jgi:hypothetical protein
VGSEQAQATAVAFGRGLTYDPSMDIEQSVEDATKVPRDAFALIVLPSGQVELVIHQDDKMDWHET